MPFAQLEEEVARQARALARIPASQLAAMKLIVNQAYENMGLGSTQKLGPILDGLMRNTPDAERFIELAEREGVGRGAGARRASATTARRPGAAGPRERDPGRARR